MFLLTKVFKIKLLYIVAIVLLFLFSCSPTKYIPKDKYLLKKNAIETDSRRIKERELEKFIRQQPNRTVLGIKFPLYLYSLSNPEKEKGISNFLREKGEAPVIWDEYLMEDTKEQIQYYLENRGYYNTEVKDTAILKNHKARVKYSIEANKPHKIRKVDFEVRDSSLKKFVYQDTSNTLLNKGDIFDVELLQKERERINSYLKTKGYYRFSEDFINYVADTTENSDNSKWVDLTVQIDKFRIRDNDSYERVSHSRYKVNKIYVYPDYDPKEAIASEESYMQRSDSTEYEGLFFIFDEDPAFNYSLIKQANYIQNGEWYNRDDVNSTYDHLNSYRLFKLINIRFREADSIAENGTKYLNAHIYLKKFPSQSYTIELEGTNSSGNLGGGGNVLYHHKNLFSGAENFETKLTGAFEILDPERVTRIDNMIKIGGEMNLDIPKFIVPFLERDRFVKKYHPKTSFSAHYNYQERPDYTRTLANMSFGYKWQSGNFDHFVNPVELNILRLPYRSEEFRRTIENTYLRNSYEDHFLSLSSYRLIFNNQDVKKSRDFQFFRINTEFGGNILSGVNTLLREKEETTHYELFGIRYAQFFKIDFDFRYYKILNSDNRLVYRFFAGGGFPYGNSSVLPFVKQYFSGGANSIRAWNVRSLGPGSFSPEEPVRYPNQTGDLKLEANMEYRFDMFWILKGALFLDMGNIWTIDKHENIPGAKFNIDEIHEDIAIGTGFGLRFDLSFSVVRLDIGLKMRDPGFEENERWLPGNRKISNNTLSWNIAIGYPF
ncbi:MAG: BamA/TamA family outer membrane protein [Bacteroidota bacterium]